MSVVERALRKLQGNHVSQSVTKQRPIARVSRRATDRSAPADKVDLTQAEGRAQIEFDLETLTNAGLYAAGNNRLAEEYRLIKQPLLRKASQLEDDPSLRGKFIMVASALAGEGKTFTSVNLSLSLASEKDWNVLLVDVDCKNPQLSRLLGVADRPGLLDHLRDPEVALGSLVMNTNVDGLSVLPLGRTDTHAAELLASSRMESFCESLSAPGLKQLVVFDSSPLLLTTEASILSSRIGQVVLVVNANKTPQQAVVEALEKLDHDRAIGLILNRADDGEDTLGYGTYQAYGYRPE